MAPEIHIGKSYKGEAVDVVAAGIICFVMITQRPPFNAASPDDPHYKLIAGKRADLFWQAHEEAEGVDIYSDEFKNLFEGMLAFNPKERFTVSQILSHPWFSGPIAKHSEIAEEFVGRKKCVDEAAHEEREQKRAERGKRIKVKEGGITRAVEGFPENWQELRDFDIEEWKQHQIREHDGHTTNT